ncbi:MAG: homoserine kinase [Alphaproteobacteria bacterium]|nr:homoserine kinase [Alphaproteobacteria bacterium]
MAVYTDVSDEELQAFAAQYDLGAVVSCKGIAEGVENTNYLLQTLPEGAEGPDNYILTLYEKRVRPADLPFFLGLMEHLAANGISCPTPIHGRDGVALRQLCGKPAVIVSFLSGMWPKRPTAQQCGALGTALAKMHIAGADFEMSRANNMAFDGWQILLDASRERAGEILPGLAETLTEELTYLEANWPQDLPTGVIHADLFPDNVFFLGDNLSGLIDFYFACNDFLAYDLAICLNAWCFESDGSFNITKTRALLRRYAEVRPLNAAEFAALPLLARGSALRFLLTRLYDKLNHDEEALVRPKDPLEFLARLRFHQTVDGPGAYGLDETLAGA